MYKTVRHGENSLQYTILPQTEEVLNNSGLKGKGRDYSPSIHVRRSRRKSTVKYVLLIIFGVIIALALASVPLYVMNGALLARRNQLNHHEVITTAPLAPAARELAKSRKKELKMSPEIVLTLGQRLDTSSTSTTPSTSTSTAAPTADRTITPPWTIPASRLRKISTSSTVIPPLPTEDNEIPIIGTPSNNDRVADHDPLLKPWEKDTIIQPTVTAEPITVLNVLRHYSQYVSSEKPAPVNTQSFDDALIKAKPTSRTPVTTDFSMASESNNLKDLKDAMLDDDDEFKDSLEVDEVFSLPPLKPDYAAPGTDTDEVTVSKAGDGGWYGARWPFVDTSSYFQWTGYSPGDNLLLPLLVAALSSIALVLLLALAVRRRKRTHAASAQIGLTADLQADDNTNLLTAENAEDADE